MAKFKGFYWENELELGDFVELFTEDLKNLFDVSEICMYTGNILELLGVLAMFILATLLAIVVISCVFMAVPFIIAVRVLKSIKVRWGD